MKPRVFVSSTFYDLKYIREDLANFIKAHEFEPILFEDGDIGYTPGENLDESCYEQMRSADMVILIVGGNYGSAASDEKEFDNFKSVTRKEFQTAISERIPIFTFIDASVYAEYGIYEVNYDKIENKHHEIKFRSTKSINVFRFIREIKGIGNISITEFKKTIEIKEFLGKQWSDMFKNYLDILKKNGSDKKLIGAVDEMNMLIKRMDKMLNGIGQKVLSDKYGSVVEQIEIENICDILANRIQVDENDRCSKEENVNFYLDAIRSVMFDGKDEIKPVEFKKALFYKLSNKGAIICRDEEFVMEDLETLKLIGDKKIYDAVKEKLIEKKYYNKIFGVSLIG